MRHRVDLEAPAPVDRVHPLVDPAPLVPVVRAVQVLPARAQPRLLLLLPQAQCPVQRRPVPHPAQARQLPQLALLLRQAQLRISKLQDH